MKEWLYTHPRRLRIVSLGCVIAGAVFFIRIVQLDTKLAEIIAEQSQAAHAASEALGG